MVWHMLRSHIAHMGSIAWECSCLSRLLARDELASTLQTLVARLKLWSFLPAPLAALPQGCATTDVS